MRGICSAAAWEQKRILCSNRKERLSRIPKIIRDKLDLHSVPIQDYVLSGVCALIGFLASFMPKIAHELDQPGELEWLRLYARSMRYMTTGPRILVTIAVCILLLVYSRFRRGGLGLAFVLGALVGEAILSAL